MLKEDITNECKRFFGIWVGRIMSINSASIQLRFLPDFRGFPMDAANTCSIRFAHDESIIQDIEGWRARNWTCDTTKIPDTFELITSPPKIITLDSIQSVRDILHQYFDMGRIAMYFSRKKQNPSMTTSNTNLFKKSVAACVEPIATRQLITNIIQKMSTSDITYQNSTEGPMESGRLSDLCSNFEKYTWIRETLMGDIESDLKFFFP